MLSLLWRPTSGLARLTSLPLVVGLAVAEGIERAGGPRTALKWPNDCLIRDRKVAGVLVEASEAGGGPAVVAGVGCNLRWRGLDPAARPAGSSTALDLEGFSGTRARLAVELLASLERRYRDFERSGFEDLRQEWQRRAAWIGSEVRVDGGGGAITGVYLGVDRSGALLLQPPEGATVAVSTGDLGPGPALRPATGSGCWHRHPSTGPELG